MAFLSTNLCHSIIHRHVTHRNASFPRWAHDSCEFLWATMFARVYYSRIIDHKIFITRKFANLGKFDFNADCNRLDYFSMEYIL